MKSGKRICWIDWAKTYAIILVVWAHISPILHDEIFLFHMPLFFMISGFLYRKKDRREELMSILWSLVIPYLLYNIFYLLPLPHGGGYEQGYIINFLLGNQEKLGFLMRPLWFIVALAVMRLICVTHIDLWIVGIISLLLSIMLSCTSSPENDYFQLRTMVLCMPFFVAGYYLKLLDALRYTAKINKIVLIICAALFFIAIIILAGDQSINVFRNNVGNNILTFYIVTFSLSFISMTLCSILFNRRSKIVETLSQGTLLILATHLIIFWKIPKLPIPDILQQLCSLVIIMLISYLMIVISERYCPILIGKRKKKE